MKTLKIGIALCLSLIVLMEQNGFAQGKSDKATKNEKLTEEQQAKREELRKKNRPTRIKDIVEQKREEAKAKSEQNGKGNGNKEGKEAKSDKGNNGKGNAYGKNKGELSGREFGQARSASAKLNSQQKREVLQQTITSGDTKVTEARGRLSRAVEELERKRKTGTITDAEYNEKQVTITRAEKAIQVLEERVNAAKALVTAPVVE